MPTNNCFTATIKIRCILLHTATVSSSTVQCSLPAKILLLQHPAATARSLWRRHARMAIHIHHHDRNTGQTCFTLSVHIRWCVKVVIADNTARVSSCTSANHSSNLYTNIFSREKTIIDNRTMYTCNTIIIYLLSLRHLHSVYIQHFKKWDTYPSRLGGKRSRRKSPPLKWSGPALSLNGGGPPTPIHTVNHITLTDFYTKQAGRRFDLSA